MRSLSKVSPMAGAQFKQKALEFVKLRLLGND